MPTSEQDKKNIKVMDKLRGLVREMLTLAAHFEGAIDFPEQPKDPKESMRYRQTCKDQLKPELEKEFYKLYNPRGNRSFLDDRVALNRYINDNFPKRWPIQSIQFPALKEFKNKIRQAMEAILERMANELNFKQMNYSGSHSKWSMEITHHTIELPRVVNAQMQGLIDKVGRYLNENYDAVLMEFRQAGSKLLAQAKLISETEIEISDTLNPSLKNSKRPSAIPRVSRASQNHGESKESDNTATSTSSMGL